MGAGVSMVQGALGGSGQGQAGLSPMQSSTGTAEGEKLLISRLDCARRLYFAQPCCRSSKGNDAEESGKAVAGDDPVLGQRKPWLDRAQGHSRRGKP